jgi:3',5'-nucleoside bisphosphate phosphatase
MLIDLQLHSTYSDGYLTPTQLAGFIAKQKIKIASLTDHNTIGGFDEFKKACKKKGIKAIPGLELYVKVEKKRINILWFNFKDDPSLHKVLTETQIRRRGQVRRMLLILVKRGFRMDVEKMLDKFTHYIPINKIVDEIFKDSFNFKKAKKEIKTEIIRESDFIKEYFKNKNHGKLRESYIDIKRIVDLRKKIGGQLILNHPGKHGKMDIKFFEKLKKIGIDGIEVLSPHHSLGSIMYFQHSARELDFITTGGSDFHRHEGNKFLIQNSLNYFSIDSKLLKGVNKIIG